MAQRTPDTTGFQLLRAALGVGSLLMLLTGLRLAVQPQTVSVKDVKSGINQLVEEGQFKMTAAQKPLLPGLSLLWGGLAGVALVIFIPVPAIPEERSATPAQIDAVDTSPDQTIRTVQGKTLADFWLQGVSFNQLAKTLDLRTRLALLDKAINSHEDGWIDRLLCCPCLLVIARPASAKSSFAAALAMCRELLLPDLKCTITVDPNAHLKVDKGIWQQHWKLAGARDDWKAIGVEIATMYRRFADSQGANYVSSIYDELTAYEGNVNAKHLGGLLPQITSKARDSEEYITLISHSDTLSCLGGKAGQAKLKDDMVQLNLGSRSVKRGKLAPTGTGTIEGMDFDDNNKPVSYPITLPRWFDPVHLAKLFPEVYGSTGTAVREEADDETQGKESGYSVGTDSSGNDPEPPLLPSCNPAETDDRNGVTARAARLAAAGDMQRRIRADLGIEPPVSTLLAVMDALVTGQAESRIIKEVMGCKGRDYDQGRKMLHLIKQGVSEPENNTED